MALRLAVLVLLSVVLGAVSVVVGVVLRRKSRELRWGAWLCYAFAALLQVWWLALAGLLFIKFQLLREDT